MEPQPDERGAARAARLLACFQKAVGHELPNQLVALRGLAQMLEQDEAERLSREGRDLLRRLEGVAGRVHALVSRLAEAGRLLRDLPPPEEVSLADAAREAIAETKKLYPGDGIEYHLREPVPFLRVPRTALRHVLLHLLRNATQAAVAGRPLRVEVGARPAATEVEFWVADNGRGLSAERRLRLFEPFPGSDVPPAGTGLGLFLVSLLVDAWGGTIAVQSEPGQGTSFTMSAPGAFPAGGK